MILIGALARRFGLSRSTLLYYDSIGLLSPSSRSESGYRKYSETDLDTLEQICSYRQMGIPLAEIKNLLDLPQNEAERLLENQLIRLSDEIRVLRRQQYAIVNILQNKALMKRAGLIDKDAWIQLLQSAGLDEEDMRRWHAEFEQSAPQAHHDFLAALGIDEESIREIRHSL